jgi:hypothetical protein
LALLFDEWWLRDEQETQAAHEAAAAKRRGKHRSTPDQSFVPRATGHLTVMDFPRVFLSFRGAVVAYLDLGRATLAEAGRRNPDRAANLHGGVAADAKDCKSRGKASAPKRIDHSASGATGFSGGTGAAATGEPSRYAPPDSGTSSAFCPGENAIPGTAVTSVVAAAQPSLLVLPLQSLASEEEDEAAACYPMGGGISLGLNAWKVRAVVNPLGPSGAELFGLQVLPTPAVYGGDGAAVLADSLRKWKRLRRKPQLWPWGVRLPPEPLMLQMPLGWAATGGTVGAETRQDDGALTETGALLSAAAAAGLAPAGAAGQTAVLSTPLRSSPPPSPHSISAGKPSPLGSQRSSHADSSGGARRNTHSSTSHAMDSTASARSLIDGATMRTLLAAAGGPGPGGVMGPSTGNRSSLRLLARQSSIGMGIASITHSQ